MSKLLSSTASTALLTGDKPVPADTDYVVVEIAYDCFNLEERDRHEIQWREDATLSDYLSGLPAGCEWLIYINGTEVTLEENGNDRLCRLDDIALILVPQGSSSMKSIMRVAMMAVSVAVALIPGMQWWAVVAVSLAAGLVNTFLLTPKPKAQKDDDKSYGIDGPKNSATENIPYPVVYGEFRVAGNLCDCYTVNVGDDQYLYLRAVLNDGEIDSATDIELNEQPIANYKDVQYRINKGTLTESVNDWFPSSIVQVNKGITLDTAWTTHQTNGPIDRARFDFVFPEGLADIYLKEGTKEPETVELAFEYRLVGDATWKPLPLVTPSSVASGSGTGIGYSSTVRSNGSLLMVQTRAETFDASQTPVQVTATDVNTKQVYSLGTVSPTQEEMQGQTFDASGDGTLAGPTDVRSMLNRVFHAELPDSTYDISASGSGEIVSVQSSGGTSNQPTNASGKVKITDSRAKPLRKSVESATLPRGTYEFRVCRTTAENKAEDHLDTVVLSDVAEINNTPVALRGTANLSIRVRLSEQLNAIPNVTAKVRGSLCRRYDDQGNLIDQVWTANNAWHALDAMLGKERGAGMDPARIDWPRWAEYAKWCDDNGINFNGVFSESGANLGDAVRQILRIGQAAMTPFGRKISVAVDRPRDPVHVFTTANIIKDSFQISYLSMADRANEYEFTYYDKTDRNKAKTIRYVDPKAVTFNEIPRTANVTLAGVDNIDQARKELWKAIYQNRLLIRRAEFDSWLDSINMTLGEVALIQHDMMQWANSGRLAAGSTTTVLNLDQRVEIQLGPEIVVNGSFPTDTNGWSKNANDTTLTLSSVGGRLRVTTNDARVKYAYQKISGLTVGKTYRIRGDLFGKTGMAVINVGTLQGNASIAQRAAAAGVSNSLDTSFVATTTTIYISCWENTATAGAYTEFDNISLQEVPATNILVQFDALKQATVTLNSAAGATLLINKPGGLDLTAEQLACKRAIIGGNDYEVISITNGATYHTVKLATAPTGLVAGTTQIELWDTDVLVEQAVSSVAQNSDGTSSVTLSKALSQAPAQFANFAFGPVTQVRKPYTLLSVSGNGLEKRKLSFIEYNAGVYGPPEVDIPVPVTSVSDRPVSHVRSLNFSFDQIVEANRSVIPVTVQWRSGHILNYAGADVFVSVNGEAPVSAGSAMNASTYTIFCKPGDQVEVTVTAFNRRGDRAALPTAPTARGTVAVQFATLDAPTALTTTNVAFEVDGKVGMNWTNPLDMSGVQNFEVEYKRSPDSVWTSLGYYNSGPVEIAGLPTGNYDVRVRSSSVTSTSVWLTGTFAVAIAPGSLMDNWNSRNDRNGDPIPAPTLPATGVVDHTLNNDGSANVSFEWLWGGDETSIDGFQVDILDFIELVTNGTFSTNTAGWTAANSATLTSAAGRLRVTNGAAVPSYAHQAVPTVAGKTYTVTLTGYSGTSIAKMSVGTTAGGAQVAPLIVLTNGSVKTFTFTALTATSYINLMAGTSVSGQYAEFDNVSVYEV